MHYGQLLIVALLRVIFNVFISLSLWTGGILFSYQLEDMRC